MHAHSFSADYVIPTSENCDYTFFKTYPLIEIDKQTFLPINAIFCINHLYRSVYFEFNKINASFDNSVKIKGFPTYITTEFSEKYLFYKFVKNTLYKQRGIKLTGDDCKKLFPKKDKEPDFYHRDGNNIFLFENKDIKITDFVITLARSARSIPAMPIAESRPPIVVGIRQTNRERIAAIEIYVPGCSIFV